MNLEEERDMWRTKAQAAEAILGFVLHISDRPFFIPETVIDEGFPRGAGIYVDVREDGPAGIEVGIRHEDPS